MKVHKLNFDKENGLIPAIVQDSETNKVLMLGYMNEEALQKTLEENKVTFFSRSKQRLWTKGETSGNFLHLVDIKQDCDKDALLVKVNPNGPVCHKGTDTCWKEENKQQNGVATAFLHQLEEVIKDRQANPNSKSGTSKLFKKGINKIAQKVGEEAVELVIEAKDEDKNLFLNEAADLMYHYLVLLRAKGYELKDVVEILEGRHK